jgi:hypothetical protein
MQLLRNVISFYKLQELELQKETFSSFLFLDTLKNAVRKDLNYSITQSLFITV